MIVNPQTDFWKSAGMHLVRRNKEGWLDVTEDYLRAYYTRPEIHPIEESCPAEHRLFEALMEAPFRNVRDEEILDIKDQDTAANYKMLLQFRDHCIFHKTIEKSYLNFFKKNAFNIPPMFIDQMVHMILRNILADETDTMVLRAAEIFFREQKVMMSDGQLMLADEEIVEMRSKTGGLGSLGELLLTSGIPTREITLDVLTEENKALYWARSDRFDTALDFRFTQPAPDAFARVVGAWIKHFFNLDNRVQAQQKIRDERWSWHIGLDLVSSKILNALYEEKQLEDEQTFPIVGLFRVEFMDQNRIQPSMQNKPAYLGLAMDSNQVVKMKPQNLLTNLPLKSVGVA